MERKYITIQAAFILSLILYGIIIALGEIQLHGATLIPREYVRDFIVIIPGPLYTDCILLYVIPIGFFFLFYAISPYLVVAYIKFHKFFYWLFRRPSKYGIFKVGTTVKAGRLFYRALIVSLFSFSISALLVEMGFADLFRKVSFMPGDPREILFMAEATFLGTFALCSVTIILFFPIWQLEDSGVVSYRVFHDDRMPVDIQGVHSIYHHILLGYAGFSTIITLIRYVGGTLLVIPPGDPAILTPIILIFLPFIVTGLLAIPIYFYERFFPRTSERVRSKLKKFNFPEITVPHFEELQVPSSS